MNKVFYIQLTWAVYRVTELFPEKEPFKDEIRNLANEILADLIIGHTSVKNSIVTLKTCFDRAEAKNWVDPRNFSVLRREYDKIQQSIENTGLVKPDSTEPRLGLDKPTNGRKEKIVGIFRENGKVKVGDLIKIFPEVNRRTLLRDLESLTHGGIIEKNGNGRGACYLARNAT